MAIFSLTRCLYNQWQGVYALYCMFVMGLMWLYKSLRRSLGDLKGSPFLLLSTDFFSSIDSRNSMESYHEFSLSGDTLTYEEINKRKIFSIKCNKNFGNNKISVTFAA